MAVCAHCQAPLQVGATFCPSCGQPIATAAPATPLAASAAQFQEQAAAAARQAWVRIQGAGPARVGLGLMALSALIGIVWKGQRSIWYAGWPEIILAVAVIAYLGAREFLRQDPLYKFWFAPHAAALYLALWSVSHIQIKLCSLLFLAGAGLLAFTYLSHIKGWLKAAGFDWRYAIYGYRRAVLIGAAVAFLALFATWVPASGTAGYWSGGYTYSSYYGDHVYDTMKYYNPGFYFAASKGIGLRGSVLMQASLLAAIFFAGFAPQFAMPQWYRFVPLAASGLGVLYLLLAGSLSWGQPIFLVGIGLVAWGGYQLSIKGAAEGPFDLREIPLERIIK